MIMAERKSNIWLTKDTPYLALMSELWNVFSKDFGENWPRYNGTTLYHTPISHDIVNTTAIMIKVCPAWEPGISHHCAWGCPAKMAHKIQWVLVSLLILRAYCPWQPFFNCKWLNSKHPICTFTQITAWLLISGSQVWDILFAFYVGQCI